MSEHLEASQISRCVLGEQTDTDRAHLEVCPDCRNEVKRFEEALLGLRGSIHRWSEHEFATVSQAAIRPVMRPVSAAWSMAVIVVISLLGVRYSFEHRPVQPVFTGSDAELIDNIQADTDRPIPRGMEPLQALP